LPPRVLWPAVSEIFFVGRARLMNAHIEDASIFNAINLSI